MYVDGRDKISVYQNGVCEVFSELLYLGHPTLEFSPTFCGVTIVYKKSLHSCRKALYRHQFILVLQAKHEVSQ